MKQVGDYVIYRKDVCKVVGVKEDHLNHLDYYSLIPIEDESLHLDIPVDNQRGYLRDLISKAEVMKIIQRIPEIEVIQSDDRMLENEYKALLSRGNHDDFIKIIKTTYLRNKERLEQKKKISDKDNHYFELAEKYLYNEIGVVLGMNYDEAKQYVLDQVLALEQR